MKPDHWKVYEFICRHFCATILPNAKIQEMTSKFQIGKEIFYYKGKRMESPGYLQAMPWVSKNYPGITQFKVGETMKVHSLNIEKAKVVYNIKL